MVENPPLGMPALKRGARGPRLSLTAPGGARLTVTVTMMVVVVTVMMMLQKHGVDGRKEVGDAGRRVGVLNVRCGCGGNLSRVLVVEPTSDRKCLPAMLRKPHELRREREGNSGGVQHRYPLKVKVRRSPEGREILVSWSLTYMPLKKRSRLSDFHVFFLTKRYRKSRKQQGRGQCFRVTGLRKVCKKKVTCKAKYLSRSRGRDGPYLQVQYQYDPSGQQKKQQKAKNQTVTYVLKASLSRRAKRRGSLGSLSLRKKSKRARKEKRSHRRQLEKQQRQMGHELFSCEAWIPTMTLSSQADRVAVTVSPVNPFATGLQLALRYAGSGSGIKPTRVLASDKHYTFTFTNVADGTYELMVLALGPQCFQARYHISNVSVSVPGSEALQDCSKWIPKVTLSLSGRSVTMHYSPVNPLATSLDIALQRPFSTLRIFSTQIPKDVTTYTFKNVDHGEYRMSIRALGPDCRSARFFISRDKVTVKEVDRNCSHWKPTITARKTAHGGSWCLIEVNIDTPPNINADKIEVAVEKSKRDSDGDGHQNEIVKVTHINVSEKKAVLNVTLEKGKSYKALVKPYGCEDCPDFQQYGEECFLSYTKVDIISDNNHEAPASILKPDKDRGPGSTLQNTQPHHGGPNSSYNNHQHHQHHLFYLYLHSDAGDSQVNEQKWQPPSADSSSHSGGHYSDRSSCDDCCQRCGCRAASR